MLEKSLLRGDRGIQAFVIGKPGCASNGIESVTRSESAFSRAITLLQQEITFLAGELVNGEASRAQLCMDITIQEGIHHATVRMSMNEKRNRPLCLDRPILKMLSGEPFFSIR